MYVEDLVKNITAYPDIKAHRHYSRHTDLKVVYCYGDVNKYYTIIINVSNYLGV